MQSKNEGYVDAYYNEAADADSPSLTGEERQLYRLLWALGDVHILIRHVCGEDPSKFSDEFRGAMTTFSEDLENAVGTALAPATLLDILKRTDDATHITGLFAEQAKRLRQAAQEYPPTRTRVLRSAGSDS